jgi:hypothetical protein
MDPMDGQGLDHDAGQGLDHDAGQGLHHNAGQGLHHNAGQGLHHNAGQGLHGFGFPHGIIPPHLLGEPFPHGFPGGFPGGIIPPHLLGEPFPPGFPGGFHPLQPQPLPHLLFPVEWVGDDDDPAPGLVDQDFFGDDDDDDDDPFQGLVELPLAQADPFPGFLDPVAYLEAHGLFDLMQAIPVDPALVHPVINLADTAIDEDLFGVQGLDEDDSDPFPGLDDPAPGFVADFEAMGLADLMQPNLAADGDDPK